MHFVPASSTIALSSASFFSSRRRHTRWPDDWSSDVCSSDLLDRHVLKRGTVAKFPAQPDLADMTRAAIQVLSRNKDGFFLMVEAALIDKFNHPLDWERAVYDTIMLSNAVQVAKEFAGKRNDTLIIVTPDHTHGLAIVGTVDDGKSGTDMREKVGTYAEAGYPNYPAPDKDGYPEKIDVSRRLAIFFADF